MKRLLRFIFACVCSCVPGVIHTHVVPYLSLRSQGFNAARESVGWQAKINKDDMRCHYGTFSVTPEYTQSFESWQLAQYLFCDALSPEFDYLLKGGGSSSLPTIRVQGTQVAQRKKQALMAENFYLPTDFSSVVSFNPWIKNAIVDFNYYAGLDNILEGLYIRAHAPLTYTSWFLDMHEKVIEPGSANYPPGYFNDTFIGAFNNPSAFGVARSHMLGSFTDYIACGDHLDDQNGFVYEGLKNARVSLKPLSKLYFAELAIGAGWNFWTNPDYHCGFGVLARVPTGNAPDGRWLFEPIVGQGQHWEVGLNLSAHACLWRAEGEDSDITFYFDGYITHLFSARQCRTFDLYKNPLSRYMLAVGMDPDPDNLLIKSEDEFVAPPVAANGRFTPVANLTTIPVTVSALAQGEILAQLTYTYHANTEFDFGVSFWGRSCDDIKPDAKSYLKNQYWALKGDEFVYGFPGSSTMPGNFTLKQPGIGLSATQGQATIFAGANNAPDGETVDGVHYAWNQNPGIDSPTPAYNKQEQTLYTHDIGAVTHIDNGWLPVNTSENPQVIHLASLDIQGAQTTSWSTKCFMHVNYTWDLCGCYIPYFGIGSEIEFGDSDEQAFSCGHCSQNCCSGCQSMVGACTGGTCCQDNAVDCDCSCCKTVSLSQWGIWLKGGFSY